MLNPFERPVRRRCARRLKWPSYVDERGNKVPSEDINETVKISGVEARQGLLGRPVLMVLIASLVLALIAWGGAEMFGESTDNDAATQVQDTIPAAKDTVPADQGTVDNTPSTGEQMQPATTDNDQTPQTGSGGSEGHSATSSSKPSGCWPSLWRLVQDLRRLPLARPPDGQSAALAPNEGEVMRQHDQAQRHHPETQDRQEAENTAEQQHCTKRDAPARDCGSGRRQEPIIIHACLHRCRIFSFSAVLP